MGSDYGTCEIIELENEPKLGEFSKKNHQAIADDKGKKPQVNKSIEDDINKLFEGINVRNSFHGFAMTNSGSNTPRRNPSKKPMRVSTSSSLGIGYSETGSLKQSLRGHCISQASEMAAMKRLSLKPPSSPALSDFRKLANVCTLVKTSESDTCVDESKEVKATTSSSSRKTPNYLQEHMGMVTSYTEKTTKTVGTAVRLNDILREPETENDSPTVNKATMKKNNPATSISSSKLVKKSTRVSPRAVKTVIRNKQTVKKKSRQDSPSVTVENVTLVCKRCHCSIKDTEKGNDTSSKSGDKSEFTQSSNSSIGEYSSSTSISEESNISRFSIGNKPHMSMDTKWQAVQSATKQSGFLGLKHFDLLKKLGSGDIGTVYLAELMGTNCLFAIKVMDNEFLERRKKMARAHTEREIMRILDHPFLPKLYAHFVSENLSCLVMEYCPGGDLHVLRQRQPGGYYHEQAARFYVAEVLVALEYLHMLGIIYRDLKPENILVREDGHIMLTDFDLSLRCSVNPTLLQSPSSVAMEPPRISGAPCSGSNCIDPFCIKPTCQVSCFRTPRRILQSSQKTKQQLKTTMPQLVAEPTEARSNSFVGTHEYLAPEIIKGDGHGSCVDWWTFGVFLYELLYGRTPFKGSGNDGTLANVLLKTLEFPDTPLVSFQARDLIKGLLVKEPENRLGSQKGAVEIKQHPFFDGLNWALIRCATPPDVPQSCDIESASKENAKKYLGYTGGQHEFEVF